MLIKNEKLGISEDSGKLVDIKFEIFEEDKNNQFIKVKFIYENFEINFNRVDLPDIITTNDGLGMSCFIKLNILVDKNHHFVEINLSNNE